MGHCDRDSKERVLHTFLCLVAAASIRIRFGECFLFASRVTDVRLPVIEVLLRLLLFFALLLGLFLEAESLLLLFFQAHFFLHTSLFGLSFRLDSFVLQPRCFCLFFEPFLFL